MDNEDDEVRKIVCPLCRAPMMKPEGFSDGTLKCKKCGKLFTVWFGRPLPAFWPFGVRLGDILIVLGCLVAIVAGIALFFCSPGSRYGDDALARVEDPPATIVSAVKAAGFLVAGLLVVIAGRLSRPRQTDSQKRG